MVIISHGESQKIPQSFYRYHREGVWCCPHCDWKNEDRRMDKWYDKYHTEELIFGSWHGKVTGFIIVSTCPSCGELSWMHEEYRMAEHYFKSQKDLMDIIDSEAKKREQYVKEMWEKSPCRTCKHLVKDTLEIQRYLVHKDCKGKGWSVMGPPVEAGEKCEHMSQR